MPLFEGTTGNYYEGPDNSFNSGDENYGNWKQAFGTDKELQEDKEFMAAARALEGSIDEDAIQARVPVLKEELASSE